MRSGLRSILYAGASAILLMTLAVAGDSAFLDGTTCHIKLVPEAESAKKGAKEFEASLHFAGGKVSSEYFSAKGFNAAKYKGEQEPNEAEFEFEQTSESEGLINWLGEIRGTNVLGRMQWQKKDGTSWGFDLEGTTK